MRKDGSHTLEGRDQGMLRCSGKGVGNGGRSSPLVHEHQLRPPLERLPLCPLCCTGVLGPEAHEPAANCVRSDVCSGQCRAPVGWFYLIIGCVSLV